MSHREYLTHLAWIEENYNDPSRTDHYLMQLILAVKQILAKNPDSVKVGPLKFGTKKLKKPKTPEERMMDSKRARYGALGLKLQEPDYDQNLG